MSQWCIAGQWPETKRLGSDSTKLQVNSERVSTQRVDHHIWKLHEYLYVA